MGRCADRQMSKCGMSSHFICIAVARNNLPNCTSAHLHIDFLIFEFNSVNMKPIALLSFFFLTTLSVSAQLNSSESLPTVKTANGILQGTQVCGISIFKGVPFAQPPIGDLRWKEPQ